VIRRTWNVLTAGGEIGVIQNDSLKFEIAAFYAETDVVLSTYDELIGMWDDQDLYLMEILDFVEIVRRYHADELSSVKAMESSLNVAEVLKKPEFRDRLANKWHISRDFLVRFQGLLDRIAKILTELDKELAIRSV
jgi:hypothetical protein